MFFYCGQCHNEHALTFGLEKRSESKPQSYRTKCFTVVHFGFPCTIGAAHMACREQQASIHPYLELRVEVAICVTGLASEGCTPGFLVQ